MRGGRASINGPWREEGHQWSKSEGWASMVCVEGGGASMVHGGRRGMNGPWREEGHQ